MPRYELGDLVWRITGETQDFDKSLTKSESRLGKFSDKAISAGKRLTTFVTAPLVGAAGASVKYASDLEESLNAVNVVFGESAGIINEFGEQSAESAGLAESEFNELATVIGAQLKQSGLAMDDVAGRTVDLTQRAADLASVFNTDVSEATTALGAALRGETEPARRFGVNISAAAVQAEALSSGLIESKDQMTEQIKIQARLNLIMEQSAQVQGDFVNTSDSLANSTRITKAQLQDAAAQLGQNLIPLAKDAVDAINDLVGWFGDLDEQGQRAVITISGLAAGMGPLLIGIGNVTKAIQQLNTTALFGPVGLIAGTVAATVALSQLADKTSIMEKRAEGATSTWGNVEGSVQAAADAVEEAESATEGVSAQAEVAAERYALMDQKIRNSQESIKRVSELEQEREQAADKAALKEKARIEGVIEARKEATENYNTEIDLIERKAELDLLTQEEVNQAKIAAEEQFQDQLLEIGYDGLENEQEQLDIGDQQLLDSIERRKQLRQQQEDDAVDTQIDITKAEKDALRARSQAYDQYYSKTKQVNDQLRIDWEDLTETYVSNFTSGFEAVGKALVNQEDAWDAFANAALGAVAAVVRALGEQLAAQAATFTIAAIGGDLSKIPGAVAAAAASAAAFTAAGVLEANAQKFQEGGFVQPEPGATGPDSVSARLSPGEVVLTQSDAAELLEAIRGGSMGGSVTDNQYNTLNTDSEKNMQRAARQMFPYLERERSRRG